MVIGYLPIQPHHLDPNRCMASIIWQVNNHLTLLLLSHLHSTGVADHFILYIKGIREQRKEFIQYPHRYSNFCIFTIYNIEPFPLHKRFGGNYTHRCHIRLYLTTSADNNTTEHRKTPARVLEYRITTQFLHFAFTSYGRVINNLYQRWRSSWVATAESGQHLSPLFVVTSHDKGGLTRWWPKSLLIISHHNYSLNKW